MDLHNNSPTIFKSFFHAFNGLLVSIKTQRNIRIEIFFFFLVLTVGVVIGVSTFDIIISLFSILSVIVTELINTSIEFLTDIVVGGKYHKEAKIVKDIAASAVLISAVFSVITVILIYTPYIIL